MTFKLINCIHGWEKMNFEKHTYREKAEILCLFQIIFSKGRYLKFLLQKISFALSYKSFEPVIFHRVIFTRAIAGNMSVTF